MTKEELRRVRWANAQKSRKYNEYEIRGSVAYVKMTNTESVMVCDADDWSEWKQYGWHENTSTHYVETTINGRKQKYHYHVLERESGYVIDHINRNKLDNRRENLRLASPRANSINAKLSSANKSGHKGVCFDKNLNKWSAYIWANGTNIMLGKFKNLNDAIAARERGETIYHKPILESETK